MARVDARSGVAVSPSTDLAKVMPAQHPAPFSNAILHELMALVPDGVYLDPFCGIGRVFQLTIPGEREFVGIELEKEWADQARDKAVAFHAENALESVTCGDSLLVMKKMREHTKFDGIVTSPVYGNRMSDHHNAQDMSHRRSYTHFLKRELTEGNSGTMYFWQPEYKEFHKRAWKLAFKVTRKGGMIFLNVSDFIREGEIVKTVKWHAKALEKAGWTVEDIVDVGTPRFRDGANSDLRVDTEAIIVGRK